MATRFLCLLCLAASVNATATLAQDRIRISIKNEYITTLNFGVLGKGSRDGSDKVEGVLQRRGDQYSGIVTAVVGSTQQMSGLGGVGNCGPARYEGSQQLQVTGHSATGFNADVQSVNPATMTGQVSNQYLRLEFIPAPGTELQPPNPDPDQDQVIECHTMIETEAGRFLPLNDSRWTMEGGGYIIALPSSGKINYTDKTVPTAGGTQMGPFNAKKSLWTIEVERLP